MQARSHFTREKKDEICEGSVERRVKEGKRDWQSFENRLEVDPEPQKATFS